MRSDQAGPGYQIMAIPSTARRPSRPSFRRPSAWVAISAACIVFAAAPAYARQTATATGSVTAARTGVPMAGVQVVVHRVNGVNRSAPGLAAVTAADGTYRLAGVPIGTVVLRARLPGFTGRDVSLELTAGQVATVNFELTQATIRLDEIVVTGTGVEMERRQLGNTVGIVRAEDLEMKPVTSFTEAIQAREPSVVGISPGVTGDGARIRIRGTNSLFMSNEPIIYVDGVRMDNAAGLIYYGGGASGWRIDDHNPDAIDRIEILKGPAAATLYGSEANSGVIQIFTKRGQRGPTRFNFRIEQGAVTYPDRVAPNAGFARDSATAARMSQLYRIPVQPYQVIERTFFKDHTETGRFQAIAAEMTGGTNDMTYFVGARWNYEDGPMGAEDLGPWRDTIRRIQANAALTMTPSSGLSIRMTGSFNDVNQRMPEVSVNLGAPLTEAAAGKPELATCDASRLDSRMRGSTPRCTGAGNPTGSILVTPREGAQWDSFQETNHFTGSAAVTYAVPRVANLEAALGIDVVNDDAQSYQPFGYDIDHSGEADGQRYVANRRHRELTFDLRARRDDRFGSTFSSNLVVGTQGYLSNNWVLWGFNRVETRGLDVLGPSSVESVTEFRLEQVNLGWLAQGQFGIRDAAYVTLGGRWDRNSTFGRNTGGAFYPKASISILPTELVAWPIGLISTLRLRGAVGESGLQPGAFDHLTTYEARSTSEGSGVHPVNLGNPDLKAEVAREWEIGGEIGMLDDRASLEVSYWDRTTRDALMPFAYPSAGGFVTSQLTNVGRIDAHGWEFKLGALPVDRPNLTVDVWANAAFLRDIVTDLGGAAALTPGARLFVRNTVEEGLAPGTFLGARLIPVCGPGVQRTCYTPGTSVPFDTNGDGIPDSEAEFRTYLGAAPSISLDDPGLRPLLDDEDGDFDRLDHVLGKPTPDWQGSFGVNLTLWNNLEIATLFEYRAGDYSVANVTHAHRRQDPTVGRNLRDVAEVEATLLNPATQGDADARFAAAMAWGTEMLGTGPYAGLNMIEPGDFVRWRELGITYRVPARFAERLGLRNVAINLTGKNLHVWTGYTGADPESNSLSRCQEASQGQGAFCNFLDSLDWFAYPIPRRWAVSLRFGW